MDIELGEAVVFIGPNNSGKTSTLQALALWELGVRRWTEKRSAGPAPEKRPGITVNRRDLIALPVPSALLLWRDLHVRRAEQAEGKSGTQNIRIEISVSGITDGTQWSCGLEFDYANEESFYCRPLRNPDGSRMAVPEEAGKVRLAFLPAMSGLAANEVRLDPGAIQVRVGEGRTAEILRNLCWAVHQRGEREWENLRETILRLFGIRLHAPAYVPERGEIVMAYDDASGVTLDISSSGRGLQQTLLLMAYLISNPETVLLLDEPDAHLEILRQRQIYELMVRTAKEQKSQIVAASHSEVLLNEAADRDIVVAFVGRPHRIDDRGSQVGKALKEIGFEHYYQAEQTGWVLYLEGSTDLSILRAFAEKANHPAQQALERPFVHYVQNLWKRAQEHFFDLREAKPDLEGMAIFDRLDQEVRDGGGLVARMWARREIENYLCFPEALTQYAASLVDSGPGPLFEHAHRDQAVEAMTHTIEALIPPIALRDRHDRWWTTVKASDEFLDRVFEDFFAKMNLPNLMRKTDYHQLARFVPRDQISSEVIAMLDVLVGVAERARPLQE